MKSFICVFALVIASTLAQQQQQEPRTVETFGIGTQLAQPDEFQCVVIVRGKANQTQTQAQAATNQTQPVAANQTQPVAGQQQASPSSQQSMQDIQNIVNTAQQLAQALQQAGALNASINMVDMVPSVRDPNLMRPVASVLFRGSFNQLQQLLQSAFQQGATSISSIRFRASKQVIKQTTNLAIQEAINNAMQQVQLLKQVAQSSPVSTGQSSQQQQGILNVRVLDIIHQDRPASEDVAVAFEQMFNQFNSWLLSGKQEQQQQGGQQQSLTDNELLQSSPSPAVIGFVPYVKARVSVRSSL